MVKKSKKETSQKDESEIARMFQAIADKGEGGILVLDKDDRIEFVNKMFSNITGHQQKDLVGITFTDFLVGENKRVFQSLKKECVTCTDKLRQVVEIKTTTSSRAVTEMCCAHYVVNSGEKKTFVYLRDISLQQKLTKELKESEKRHRELFEHIDQGISISTREGKFIDCNPAILKILGYESKEEF
jgi:two-component system NtrC family sensor kinase